MDMQICRVCKKRFDFDTEGLGTVLADGQDFLTCGPRCAKQGATSRGNYYAIHDEDDRIVEDNIGS